MYKDKRLTSPSYTISLLHLKKNAMITITASLKKGEAWAQFEANEPIGTEEILLFHNIDEATEAPLAQQLFYLPFVKTVAIEQYVIRVERFDILEWEEVITEVATQIENYINEGGVVISPKKKNKIPVSIYAESTPTPAVMKFVANKPLVVQTVEFKNIDEAKGSPLALRLFHFPFVKEVFMDSNYVSITKYEMMSWDEIVMEVRTFIREHIEQGHGIVDANFQNESLHKGSEKSYNTLGDTEKEIVNILEAYIKPAVASDGGNIVFEDYDQKGKTVKVVLQGACSGCPSSTFTLKNGIETMLKEMLPGKINQVEAING